MVVTHLFKIQLPKKISYRNSHRLWLIDQKLNSKGFVRPLSVTHSLKIRFAIKKFIIEFFINMHRFRLIYRKLNLERFFWPWWWHIIQFPTKNILAKFIIKMHIFRLIHRNLHPKSFFDPWWCYICWKFDFLQKFSSKIFDKRT